MILDTLNTVAAFTNPVLIAIGGVTVGKWLRRHTPRAWAWAKRQRPLKLLWKTLMWIGWGLLVLFCIGMVMENPWLAFCADDMAPTPPESDNDNERADDLPTLSDPMRRGRRRD